MEVWPFVLTSETFRLRIPTERQSPKRLRLKVQILSEGGEVLRTERTTATWQDVRWPEDVWAEAGLPTGQEPRGGWIAELPIEPTEPGTYRFVAEPAEIQDTTFADPEVVLYEQPDWLHAQAGIEGLDQVLEPWTPVKTETVEGDRVLSCWNRRTILGDAGLVKQITSGETQLLTSPIELSATDNQGRQLELEPEGDWKVTEQKDTHVAVRRRWSRGDSHADVTITQEYDGLIWLQIDLTSETGIEQLEITVPVDRELAPLIYYFPDLPWYFGNINNVIKTPRPSMGWSASWRRWIWLGGMDAGLLCWLADKEKWQNPDEPNTISLQTTGDTARLCLRVLKGPETSTRASCEFVLQATPVKPWPEEPLHNRVSNFNWRAATLLQPYRALGEPFKDMKYIDRLKQAGYKVISLGEWWTTSWGGTEPREPEDLRRLTREAHERDMQVIVYFGFEIDEEVEAFKQFPWEMVGGDPRLRSYKEHRFYGPARFDQSVPSRKAYGSDRSGPEMERLLAGMKKLLTEYHVDGFYLDGTQLPSGSLRKARELMKRMRYLADTYGTRGVVYAHTSSRNNIAVNAFADVVYDGEQLRYVPEFRNRKTVAGVFPEDYFFLVMNGRPWGVPHDLCAGREFTDAALLLDTGVNTYQWRESYWALQKIWVEADLWHADYVPPHVVNPRWEGRPRDVFASYYRSEDELYTVVIFNRRASDVQIDLPVSAILQLADGVELKQPRVAYCHEDVQWEAADGVWRGTVPGCRSVVLQAERK